MKLLNHAQINELAKFKSQKHFITSAYLDTNKSHQTYKEIKLRLKNLLNRAKTKLGELNLSKEKKESLQEDLSQIEKYLHQNLSSYHHPGLAIFSCARENFWEEFNLPEPPRNRIIFDRNAYVRHLSAILDEHKRIGTLVLDRKEAKLYQVFMDDIKLIEEIRGEVPPKVREGGWEGYESKRIERHIETHLHDYFKICAQKTFNLFQKNQFEWFFLGCKEEYLPIIKEHLHPYLLQRFKGQIKATPNDNEDKTFEEIKNLEKELKEKEKEQLVKQLISEIQKDGLAITGLDSTLDYLNRSAVQSLLVTRYYSQPGYSCPKCHFLYASYTTCPGCQIPTQPVLDVIDEAIEMALDKNCEVKHINPPTQLQNYGHIGAFLRFKP